MQLSGHKIQKFALLGNCFSDIFTDVETWYQINLKFVLGGFLKDKENSSLNMTVFDKYSC